MSFADFLAAVGKIGELLNWIAEHPVQASVLVPIVLGLVAAERSQLRALIDGLAGLLVVPFSRTASLIQPFTEARPPELIAGTARFSRSVGTGLLRPFFFPWGAVLRLAHAIGSTWHWSPEVPTRVFAGVVEAVAGPVKEVGAGIQAGLAHAMARTVAFLSQGSDGEDARVVLTWRLFGGALYGVLLVMFLYADLGLILETLEKRANIPLAGVPEFLRLPALQLAMTSVLSALAIGFVFFDLIGVTHFGPWSTITSARPKEASSKLRAAMPGLLRGALAVVSVTLVALAVLGALGLSVARGDQISAPLWRETFASLPVALEQRWVSSALALNLFELGLDAPVPLMLIGTFLVATGAVWTLPVVALLGLGSGWIVAGVAVLIGEVIRRATPFLAVVFGWILRGAGLVVLGLCVVSVVALIAVLGGFVLPFAITAVVAAFVVIALWWVIWTGLVVARELLFASERLTRESARVLVGLVDLVARPGVLIWNLLVVREVAPIADPSTA